MLVDYGKKKRTVFTSLKTRILSQTSIAVAGCHSDSPILISTASEWSFLLKFEFACGIAKLEIERKTKEIIIEKLRILQIQGEHC